MVLLTPALRALKVAYPHSHLALLIRPLVADLMAAHPYVDQVIVDRKTVSSNRLKSLWELIRALRRADYDLAVVLHPTSLRNALIPFLAGIPERIGSDVAGRRIFLTSRVPDRTDLHEIRRYLRVLSLIDIHHPRADLEFWHTDADRNAVRQMLEARGVFAGARMIGVNLSTTWQTKRWELDSFAAVIARCKARWKGQVVLTGSPADTPLGEALQRAVGAEVINLIGKTTVLQLGALIERCEIYLTCDSGPMHIAAAVGAKTVALFGPTSPVRHRPYGEGHDVIEKPVECRPCYKRRCKRRDSPNLCMTEISPVEVADQILKIS